MKRLNNFFSRKFLVTIGTIAINILIGKGIINTTDADTILKFCDAIAGLYVLTEGVLDIIKRKIGI